MASLYDLIILYLEGNGVTDFNDQYIPGTLNSFQLSNKGDGDFILIWGDNDPIRPKLSGVSKPTHQDLQRYEVQAEKKQSDTQKSLKRFEKYGNVQKQLLMIFNDIENNQLNKNGNFYKFIKKINDDNPID
jgi:hypothetical protein